jgi:LysR family transcriptional regulator of abg operon
LLKINQISAFISIAEGKGVAGAAQELFVSQPAITKSIGNLEAQLGVSLFDRSKHRLTLNEYGEIFLRRAKAAKAELECAQEEISFMKERSQRTIKFNGSPAVIPKLIPKAINLFKQSHPDVNVELAGLLDDNPANKVQALMRGDYDLLITVIDENEANYGLAYEKLLDIEVTFVASDGHPALALNNPSLKDLVGYDWLFPGAGGLPFKKLRAAFRGTQTPIPRNVSTIANRQVIFSLLDEGMYIAAIPCHPMCLEKSLDDLNVFDINIEKISWPIYLIRRENSVLSPALTAFISQLKDVVAMPS